MKASLDLGSHRVRCPRCRGDRFERIDRGSFELRSQLRCAGCEHVFCAEDGVDMRRIERKVTDHATKEIRKALKGLDLTLKF